MGVNNFKRNKFNEKRTVQTSTGGLNDVFVPYIEVLSKLKMKFDVKYVFCSNMRFYAELSIV